MKLVWGSTGYEAPPRTTLRQWIAQACTTALRDSNGIYLEAYSSTMTESRDRRAVRKSGSQHRLALRALCRHVSRAPSRGVTHESVAGCFHVQCEEREAAWLHLDPTSETYVGRRRQRFSMGVAAFGRTFLREAKLSVARWIPRYNERAPPANFLQQRIRRLRVSARAPEGPPDGPSRIASLAISSLKPPLNGIFLRVL